MKLRFLRVKVDYQARRESSGSHVFNNKDQLVAILVRGGYSKR